MKKILNLLFIPLFVFQSLSAISNNYNPTITKKIQENNLFQDSEIPEVEKEKKPTENDFQNFQRGYRSKSKIIEGFYIDSFNFFKNFPHLKKDPIIRKFFENKIFFYLKYDFNGNKTSEIVECFRGEKIKNKEGNIEELLTNHAPVSYYIHSNLLERLNKNFIEKGKKGYYHFIDKDGIFNGNEIFNGKVSDLNELFKIKYNKGDK